MQGKYTVKGMGFHAFHGSLEVERELGTIYLVDVTFGVELTPNDDSSKVISGIQGADVYEVVKGLMMGSKFKSIMSLALHIARELLRNFSSAQEATVKITSKQLFIPGNVDSVVAEASATRADI